MVRLLDRLVAFDTESQNSNEPLIAFVEAYLAARGVSSRRFPNRTGDKAALWATIGPAVDGGIVLSAHTDVVPVAGQRWTGDPYRLRATDGRFYGRGAVDMKGFVALALALVDEIKAAPLAVPIHMLLTYDEETTCLGPVDTIARFGIDLPRPRAVIVGEPTEMAVADAHKSVSTYRTVVTGHEGHSSKPDGGVNAIEIGAALVGALYAVGHDLKTQAIDPRFDPPSSTVSVGMMAGGTARNILARECHFNWEFRGLPGVPASTARQKLDAFAAGLAPRFAGFPNAAVVTVTEIEVPALSPDPGSVAETLALKLTQSNRTTAVPFATEAGRFQSAGIPTVVCGPGSIAQAHQADEFIAASELDRGLEFLRSLIGTLS